MLGGNAEVTALSQVRISRSQALWAAASILVPVVMLSLYFFASRSNVSPMGDRAVFFIALVIGATCAAFVPTRWYWRVIVAAAYACVMTIALGWFSLAFVCKVFGDCL